MVLGSFAIVVPIQLLATLERQHWRLSLQSLLIFVTLVSLVLGAIVCANS